MKKLASFIVSMSLAISCLASGVSMQTFAAQSNTIGKISNFKAAAASTTSIKLNWTKIQASQYHLYKYNTSKKKYELYKKLKTNSYTDNKLQQFTKYAYKIKAVKNVSGKTVNSNVAAASCITKLAAPSFSLSSNNKGFPVIKWAKNTKATGYQIFRSVNGGEYKLLKAYKGHNTLSLTDKTANSKNSYYYKVRAFRIYNGKTYYGYCSSVKCNKDISTQINTAALKPHKIFTVYNKQGATNTSYDIYLTDNDINILKKFASAHFTKNMTREDKLLYTLKWINKNVKYAKGNLWNQIADKTWVDAIFTYKKGQCAQYNGAMAAMMVYLGYDAYMIQGYRGQWDQYYWQHFWCEVNLGGLKYLIETGNYGEDGDWSYFMTPYSQTSGYIINCKNVGYQY